MDPIILRSFERILDALIGGLSIYLGYRLFLKMPDKMDSAGKVVLPGNISVYMTRVGPGAFFALFGAIVVALSLHNSISYNAGSSPAYVGIAPQPKTSYIGALSDNPEKAKEYLKTYRTNLQPSLYWLNQLSNQIKSSQSEEDQVNMELYLPAIKLELMQKVWGSDWCSIEEFEDWVSLGAETPLPKDCEQAKELFFWGSE